MSKKEKEIPTSNYVKLSLLVIATIVLALVCRNYYFNHIKIEKSIPVIKEVLVSEIKSNEVYNYIRENDNAILYIGVADNDNCRSLEKELKEVIRARGLENRITYLNLTDTKKRSSFIKEFNKFYDTKLLGYPSFIIFNDGKVQDILTVKDGNSLSLDKVINFFNNNNINDRDYD